MSNMKNNKILKIAFFAQDRNQIYKIHNKLNPDQDKKYRKSPLWDLRFSISKKLYLIQVIVRETNLEMDEINKILKRENKEVSEIIKRNAAYTFKEIYRIYKILAYIETALIEMDSVTRLMVRYISYFFRYIFEERKGAKEVWEELEDKCIETEWSSELYFLRRGIVHHYSGWLSFKKKPNNFELVIELPKSIKRMKDYKKYHYDTLDREKFNDIYKRFHKFMRELNNYLVKKIESQHNKE